MFKLEDKPNIHLVGRWLLYLFITLIIANGIAEIPLVSEVAKVGKLVVLVVALPLLSSSQKLLRFVRSNRLVLLFWILCLIFSVYQSLVGRGDSQLLLTNFTFGLYIYFFYLVVESFYFESEYTNSKLVVVVSGYLSKILNVNFLFWTVLGIAFGIPIWHQLDDRIGLGLFYSSYIQMGIYGVCGAIVHLLMLKFVGKSKKNLLWFLVYLTVVALSNSRNAQMVLVISAVLLFSKDITAFLLRFRWIVLTGIVAAIVLMGNIYTFLLNDEILKLTTGRSTIWSYVLRYYEQESLFSGRGIFGLNNEILSQNKSANYYFDRIDFLYFHNSYIEFFAAAGIAGFLAITAFFISNLVKSKKSALNAVIIAILFGAFFESFLVQPVILITLIFWLYLFVNQLSLTRHTSDGQESAGDNKQVQSV